MGRRGWEITFLFFLARVGPRFVTYLSLPLAQFFLPFSFFFPLSFPKVKSLGWVQNSPEMWEENMCACLPFPPSVLLLFS